MPIIQPCQDAAPNYFKNFFERIRVESPESLESLKTDALLNLLNNWFLYRNFLQTKSCNFNYSLFANVDMNEATLRERKSKLELTLRKIEILSTDPTVNPMVMEYSKKLIDLAIADHCAWLDIKYGVPKFAFLSLPSLEKTTKEVFPRGNDEMVSSLKLLREGICG